MIPRFYIASKVAEFKKENGRVPTLEEYKQIAFLATQELINNNSVYGVLPSDSNIKIEEQDK